MFLLFIYTIFCKPKYKLYNSVERFGEHCVTPERQPRPFDIPWIALDSSRAEKDWNWRPPVVLPAIPEEVAEHAISHPGWLDMTS